MNLERIEQALREGPVDEPSYRPGTFRRTSPLSWPVMLAAATVAAALFMGIVIGSGVSVLRNPFGQPGKQPPDPAALRVALVGGWETAEISKDDWTAAILARGFAQADITAFLAHDPFERTIRYQLKFASDRLIISSLADAGTARVLSNVPYEILADGRLRYDDLGCIVSVFFVLDGDGLTFAPISVDSCNADEQIANRAFLNLAPYTRFGGLAPSDAAS
jgi:hypothetical protein